MLSVPPRHTDLASIVFSDEGEILKGSADPDLLYNQIIRPWKSRLALACIDHRSFWIDLWLIVLTVVAILSKPVALASAWNPAPKLGARPARHPHSRTRGAALRLSATRR